MSKFDIIELSACVDCLLFFANGDIPEYRPELLKDIKNFLGDDLSHVAVNYSEETHIEFGSMPCQSCGSHLAGLRDELAILKPK